MAELSGFQAFYTFYFKQFHCIDCGSDVAYRSRPRSLTEKYVLPVFRLQTVRCADCFRRFVRPASMPARERVVFPHGAPHSQMPPPPQAGSRVA